MSKFEEIAVEIFKKKFRAEKRLMLLNGAELEGEKASTMQNQSKAEISVLIRDYDSLINETLKQACS